MSPLLGIDVVTVFPEYLAPIRLSLIGRAARSGILRLDVHDLRDWTTDRHRTVDDTPYGGGAGMVMRPEPWGAALDALAPPGLDPTPTLVVPSPAGELLNQSLAHRLAEAGHLIVACGRYEGIDDRVLAHARGRLPVVEVSIGDVVLAGGEAAALVVIEAAARLVPGVLGNPESLVEESHATHAGLLEYPLYTRPPSWRAWTSPRCSSPVITPGSPGGAGPPRCAAPPRAGRTCWRPRRPDVSIPPTAGSSPRSAGTSTARPSGDPGLPRLGRPPPAIGSPRCLWQTAGVEPTTPRPPTGSRVPFRMRPLNGGSAVVGRSGPATGGPDGRGVRILPRRPAHHLDTDLGAACGALGDI